MLSSLMCVKMQHGKLTGMIFTARLKRTTGIHCSRNVIPQVTNRLKIATEFDG